MDWKSFIESNPSEVIIDDGSLRLFKNSFDKIIEWEYGPYEYAVGQPQFLTWISMGSKGSKALNGFGKQAYSAVAPFNVTAIRIQDALLLKEESDRAKARWLLAQKATNFMNLYPGVSKGLSVDQLASLRLQMAVLLMTPKRMVTKKLHEDFWVYGVKRDWYRDPAKLVQWDPIIVSDGWGRTWRL